MIFFSSFQLVMPGLLMMLWLIGTHTWLGSAGHLQRRRLWLKLSRGLEAQSLSKGYVLAGVRPASALCRWVASVPAGIAPV